MATLPDINQQSTANLHLKYLVQSTRITVTPTLSYTGISFVLNSPAVFTVYQSYSNTAPRDLGIATSSTDFNNGTAIALQSQTVDKSLTLTVVLDAGTYYIWASGLSTGGNDFVRRIIYL